MKERELSLSSQKIKELEKQLKDREDRSKFIEDEYTGIKNLMDHMPVILFSMDNSRNILYWNNEAEKITGYSTNLILSNPSIFPLLFPVPEQLDKLFENIKRKIPKYKVLSRVNCSNGSEKHILWESFVNPVKNDKKEIHWVAGKEIKKVDSLLKDLQEKEIEIHTQLEEINQQNESLNTVNLDLQESNIKYGRINDKLRQSEDIFQTLSEQSLLSILIIQNNTIKYFNKAFNNLSGYGSNEISAWGEYGFSRLVHEKDHQRVKMQLEKHQVSIPGKIKETYEYRLITKEKTIKWIRQWNQSIEFENDPAVLITCVNIDAEKKYEGQIIRERNKVHHYLNIVQAIVLVLTPEHRVEMINARGCKILELDEYDIKGLNWVDNFVLPGERKATRQELDAVFLGKKDPVGRWEQWIFLDNRNRKLIQWRSTILKNNNNKITGILLSGEDITLTRRVQQSLKKSEKTLRIITSTVPALIAQINKKGIIKYINREVDFFENNNVLGSNITGWFPPRFREGFKQAVKDTIAGNDTRNFTAEILSNKKEKHFLSIRMAPLEPDEDESSVILIASDISEQKQIQEALKYSLETYRTLTDTMEDFIIVHDLEGKISYVNEAMENTFGFKRDFFIGKNIRNLTLPEYCEEIEERLKNRNLGFHERTTYETKLMRKNGNYLSVEINSNVLMTSNNTANIMLVGRNISVRKTYEEKLKFEVLTNNALAVLGKELLLPENSIKKISKLVLNSAKLLTSSTEGYVSSIHPETHDNIIHACTRGLGVVFKKSCKNLVFEKKETGYALPWGESLNTGKSYFYNEPDFMKIPHPAAEKPLFQNILNVPAAMDKGLVGQIVLINKEKKYSNIDIDVVEKLASMYAVAIMRFRMEDVLVKARLKAEDSDRLKSSFLANMSHEIRTPMNGIIGFANLLNREDIEEADRKEFVKIINNNGKSLLNLIDDIIDISKIEAGQLRVKVTSCEINDLLKELHAQFHELLTTQYPEREVSLIVESALPNDEIWIKTDPSRLRQVLVNLIGNAVKFTEAGGIKLGFTISREKGHVRFFVEDTGIGIEKDKINLIFDRFRQLNESPTRKAGGTGLGLTISKHIVQLLGGNIWAESKEGKGSTFYFTLPLHIIKKNELLTYSRVDKRTFDFDFHGKNILIVEDEDINYLFLNNLLKRAKVRTRRAENGQKAIDQIKTGHNFDLILMDIKMPVMNGIDATKEIKKLQPLLPIIAQTAYAMEEEKQSCLHAGCDDYIAKPIDENRLFCMIDSILKTGKSQ